MDFRFIDFRCFFLMSQTSQGQCTVNFPNATDYFCAGSDFILSPTISSGASAENPTISWTYQANSSSSASVIANQTNNTLVINNPNSADAGIYTILLDFPNSSSCSDISASVTLNEVSPNINAGNNFTICDGQTANLNSTLTGLTNAETNAVVYAWTSNVGSFSSSAADPNFNGLSNGNTNFTVTATLGYCQVSDVVQVTENALPPQPSFNLPATGCPQVNIPVTGFTLLAVLTTHGVYLDQVEISLKAHHLVRMPILAMAETTR